MKLLRSLIFGAILSLIASAAFAQQSSPGWTYGYVPTPAEWNFWFAKKVDWAGASYCPTTGCTMTGPLLTAASTALSTGLNIAPGVAPSSPNNGDVWVTSAGVFAQINGVTTQLSSTSSPSFTGPVTITSNSANALAVGPNGTTNPTLQVNSSSPSAATGLQISGAAAGSAVGINVLSSATNEALTINAKGSGVITIGAASTGNITIGNASTAQVSVNSAAFILTGANAQSLVVSPVGITNPTLQVDDSTASAATGLYLKAAAAGGGIALSTISSGTNESFTIDAKGSGSVKINTVVGTGGFGFNVGSDATNDMYYRNSSGLLTRIPIGTNTQVLTISGGSPSWQPGAAAATINVGTTTMTGTCSNTQILFNNSGTTGCETLIPSANGGTGVASPTAHSLLIAQGSSAMTNTGTGTAGQALFSNGGSSDPSYKSGAWVLLNTLTANNTSSNLTDTTSISATYTEYEIVLEQVLVGTTSTTLQLQFQVGGTFQTSNYLSAEMHTGTGGTPSGTAATTGILASSAANAVTTGGGISGRWLLSNPAQTLTCKNVVGYYSYLFTGPLSVNGVTGGCYNGGSGAITGIQLNESSGNIASGVMKIYGRL